MLKLYPNEIHFFYTPVNEVKNDLLLNRYRSVLNEKERAKVSRFVFEKDRHVCLVTRALLRFVLSGYIPVAPEKILFCGNAYGKPELTPDFSLLPIRFNLSHSGCITACAFALNTEIGMDTEDISRKIDLSVADNFFSKNESDFLNKSPEADRQNLFFDLWTLKEAYIKAKGLGLSIGLDTFSFFLDGDAIDVRFDDSLCDASDQWRFFKFYPVDSYVASIALQTDSKSPCKLHIYKCIPFVSIEKIVCKGGIAVSL